jgi:hydroxymethylpyrimidine/phosphomethylpyrimidine kinase
MIIKIDGYITDIIKMTRSILSIAGFDPSGGAGLQMDVKTASKLGSHIFTSPTCLTIQNSRRFDSINPVGVELLKKQINTVLEDGDINIVKIGLLPNKQIIFEVCELLRNKLPDANVIIDPIISSTTGKKILDEDSIEALRGVFLPNSYLITPNINEASILSGVEICDLEDVKIAARSIQGLGVKNVLVKGGHLNVNSGEICHLLLNEDGEEVIIRNRRIDLPADVRGTGCMLSTAIACFLAQGNELREAAQKADDFVNLEIRKAQMVGSKMVMA